MKTEVSLHGSEGIYASMGTETVIETKFDPANTLVPAIARILGKRHGKEIITVRLFIDAYTDEELRNLSLGLFEIQSLIAQLLAYRREQTEEEVEDVED